MRQLRQIASVGSHSKELRVIGVTLEDDPGAVGRPVGIIVEPEPGHARSDAVGLDLVDIVLADGQPVNQRRLPSRQRGEGDACAVRRPSRKARAASSAFVVSELLESASVRPRSVYVKGPTYIGLESQGAPVWAPRRLIEGSRVDRQAVDVSAVRVHQVKVAVV